MGIRDIRLTIALGTGIILATIAGGSAFVLERARQTALQAAEAGVQNAATVIENTVNRQLLQVDGALVSLPPLFAAVADRPLVASEAERLLKAFDFQTFSFRDILLVRPDGTIWAAARPHPRNGSPPAFPPHSDTGPAPGAAQVEGPVRNPATGEWSTYLVRSIVVPGVGAMQALAEVPVPYLMSLLSPVGEIPGLRIGLERSDGTLLASLPHDELRIGKKAKVSISRLAADSTAFLVSPKFIATPSIGIWRHTLYPDLKVVLSLDLKDALHDWVRDRNRLLFAGIVTAVLVLAFARELYAAQRQRERAEVERQKSHAMLDSAIEAMPDGFVMWDQQDRLVVCNRRFREIYALSAPFMTVGASFEEVIRQGAEIGQYPQAGDDIEKFVRETVAWHRSSSGSRERLLPGDRWLMVSERQTPTGCTVGIRTDITQLKQALTDLAAANERTQQAYADLRLHNDMLVERDHVIRTQNILFTAALNNMSQGLLMVDSERRLIVCNARFLDMFQIPAADAAPGTTAAALFAAIRKKGALSANAIGNIYQQQEALCAAQRPGTFTVSDDENLAVAVSQRPLTDNGWVATYEDVTEQQRTQRRVSFMAQYDTLTRLPNRAFFRSKLQEMVRSLQSEGSLVSLLYIDLDRFKHVNDTLGHPAGDALLEAAAARLAGCIRGSDIVARLGGDEFAVISRHPASNPEIAVDLAKRVIEQLRAPYHVDNRHAEVGVSIGIATTSDFTTDADTLLKNADMALYQAKADGRGMYRIFAAEMEARLRARLEVEADLRVALDRNEFQLAYQPIYSLQDQRICGFEALLRWVHPVHGVVSPGAFIPLAEEQRIIKPIGAWVIRQACADAAHLPDWVKVAINLSPLQLDDDEIVDTIVAAVNEHALQFNRLELEITESVLLEKSSKTMALLTRLHKLGLSIALDDFGTGYSSLSYLRSFPFDKIKIDRLFVSEMTTRADCAAIVGSIVELASKLGITTTAEGVETEDQLHLVRLAGVETVQGYLFGCPQPFGDAAASLTSARRTKAGHAGVMV